MKICPQCKTEYKEEIIRFCTKDGVPLESVDAMPKVDEDGEQQTIIRKAKPIPIEDETVVMEDFPSPDDTEDVSNEQIVGQQPNEITQEWQEEPSPVIEDEDSDETVVVAASAPVATSQSPLDQNEASSIPNQEPPPKKSKSRIGIILALLGLFGFLFLAITAGAVYLYFQSQNASDDIASTNANVNSDANAFDENDAEINLTEDDTNGNTENSNSDDNSNLNSNDNKKEDNKEDKKTPTPTKTPKKTPTPKTSPTDENTPNDNIATPTPRTIRTPPPPPPPPRATPTPNIPSRISGGVVNGKATSLPRPVYPASARAANIKGTVNVSVIIDKNGRVISANAVSGHPLLRRSAVQAARRARFAPTRLSGQAVEVSGVIVYNFQ